ncbi:MAG: metallophosphoesterase [Clostridia bacterium]|nr:metallophosphoesterase [Clostridia bacterium]
MRILAVSDSHGDVDSLVLMAKKEDPDIVFHMGDCVKDALALEGACGIPTVYVPGNNDFCRGMPDELEVEFEGKNILLLHGHTRGVILGKGGILSLARVKDAAVVFFGHTHKPFFEQREGIYLVNPGQASRKAGRGEPGSYAMVELTEDNVRVGLYRL